MDFERGLHRTDNFPVHRKGVIVLLLVIVSLAFASGFSKVFVIITYIYTDIDVHTSMCI